MNMSSIDDWTCPICQHNFTYETQYGHAPILTVTIPRFSTSDRIVHRRCDVCFKTTHLSVIYIIVTEVLTDKEEDIHTNITEIDNTVLMEFKLNFSNIEINEGSSIDVFDTYIDNLKAYYSAGFQKHERVVHRIQMMYYVAIMSIHSLYPNFNMNICNQVLQFPVSVTRSEGTEDAVTIVSGNTKHELTHVSELSKFMDLLERLNYYFEFVQLIKTTPFQIYCQMSDIRLQFPLPLPMMMGGRKEGGDLNPMIEFDLNNMGLEITPDIHCIDVTFVSPNASSSIPSIPSISKIRKYYFNQFHLSFDAKGYHHKQQYNEEVQEIMKHFKMTTVDLLLKFRKV